MNLPKNGNIVVIDDTPEEALPLLKVLSRNHVPVTYFNGGESEELPDKPIENIRILFLDLNLVASTDAKTIRSALIMNLRKIVSEKNGSYILILWSLNDHKLESMIEDLFENELRAIKPTRKLTLEKFKYFELGENNQYTTIPNFLELIEEKIKRELQDIGVFQLFVLWENIVHDSSNQIVKEFTSFYNNDGDWNKNLSNVILQLARAYAGKQLKENSKDDILQNGLLTFSGTFMDTLQNAIREFNSSDIKLEFASDGNIPQDICAKINSKLLLLESLETAAVHPGNVYEIEDIQKYKIEIADLYNGELQNYSKKDQLFNQIKHILMEISPTCDFAQSKWKLSRLLPGVMWPIDHWKKINKADYIYTSSPYFEINGNIYKLVFDFRCLTSTDFATLEKMKPFFRIKHELLVDIQSHLARHINRPGVTFVTGEK